MIHLTYAEPLSGGLTATLSPDNTRIVFNSHDTGNLNYQIFTSNLDGSDIRQLTRTHTDNLQPVYSPDGKWITFYRVGDQENSYSGDIYSVHPDGTGETSITGIPGEYFSPVWEPGGRWLAFASLVQKHLGHRDIYLIRVDGHLLIRVTHSIDDEGEPAWRVLTSK
jgi:TolB protein